MAIYLKFLKDNNSEEDIKQLGFCLDNDENIIIDKETALKEGFTITPETLDRINKLSALGQMYEQVEESHKSEFEELNEPPE